MGAANMSVTDNTTREETTVPAGAGAQPGKGATPSPARQRRERFKPRVMEELKRKLIAERARYQQSADDYEAEAQSLLETREPGDDKFDEEGGEGDTIAVERERDIALSWQSRSIVEQIEEALKRMQNGTYGYCVISGKPIPLARLRAIPWAAETVEVKAGGFPRP